VLVTGQLVLIRILTSREHFVSQKLSPRFSTLLDRKEDLELSHIRVYNEAYN